MQPEYEEMLRWVGIQVDWHVLDAGCGSGSFVPLLTELVGSRGSVSAIDLAPENVRLVQCRVAHSQGAAPVSTRVGSILELPYSNRSFDAVWCANATQYLTDSELQTMLREFRRVVRPHGLVAIKEYDITALQLQPAPPTLVSHLVDALCRAGHLQIRGTLRTLHLPKWLREAGLVEIRQKPTLMVRLQPLRPVERALVCDALKFYYSLAQGADIPAKELEAWRNFADVESLEHITTHPDFQYRGIQTVFVARTP